MRFVLEELLGSAASAPRRICRTIDELAQSVLEEAARFAENVLEPLNRPGDVAGARWTEQGVVAAPGFAEAYRQFVAGGWPALGGNPEFGGQPVPRVLVTAVSEFWGSANLAFKLGPMLTQGAAHALELCGSPAQKSLYLAKLVSGEWTGTMVLTEPQAGSDLGQVRTRAAPEADHYRLSGQKIFITWGDHDLTPNTLHMVLGRVDGAPAGVKGISLFIVSKFLVNPDGSLGARNEVRCLSIEHKLGIQASPTCVLAFGERDGATPTWWASPTRTRVHVRDEQRPPLSGERGYAVGERAFQRARVGAHAHPGQGSRRGRLRSVADHPPPGREAHAAAHEGPDRGLTRPDALHRLPV
jgi:acyl-CoA dehydrogenase